MSETNDTAAAKGHAATSERAQGVFIQALALGIAGDWRRCPPEQRRRDVEAFLAADERAGDDGVVSEIYTSVGLEPGIDLVLWRSARTLDALESAGARLLGTDLGASCTVRHSLIGLTAPSQYAAKATPQESGLLTGERSRYLIVYPFTKATDWYLQSREARQGIMNEHMRVGRTYPTVRQALAYSFGLDDQDFVVAYETDDLPAFGDLVRDLRGTDSRRSTIRDTPLLLGIHRPKTEILGLLAGDAASKAGAEPGAVA